MFFRHLKAKSPSWEMVRMNHSKWQTSLKRAIFGFLFWGGSSMEKLRLIRPSWRDWRKSQLTHYPTTQKPFYQFQPNSKKLNAKVLPLWVNSQAGGWSTGRSQAVKSILRETVSLNRLHIFLYIHKFHFQTFY